MANPNYNEERQKYIPEYFDTTPAVNLAKCTSTDTALGEMLSNYSVLSKVDNVEALYHFHGDNRIGYTAIHSTRRGIEFYNACAAKMPDISYDTEGKYRILVITGLQGKRAISDFDENKEILVFDKNGFLVANPKGMSSPAFGKSLSMVIDGVLYIAFKHDRYDVNGPSSPDTTGASSTTSSMEFSVVVITTAKAEFEPYATAEFWRNDDPSASDYDTTSCTVTASSTTAAPYKFGLDVANHTSSKHSPIEIERRSRWARSDAKDLSFFVKTDLEAIYQDIHTRINSSSYTTSAELADAVQEIYPEGGRSVAVGYSLDVLRNIYNEIAEILFVRSAYIHFLCPESSLDNATSSDGGNEIWWNTPTNHPYVTSWRFVVVKDYIPFNGTGDNRKFYFYIGKLPKGSQFCIQSREMPFSCGLTIEHTGTEESTGLDTYDITSYGDNENLSNCIKALKLFDAKHGLLAIPLISYVHAKDDSASNGTNEIRQGFPLRKVKAPDVMLWIDGVKMVPYVDFTVEEGVNGIYSCQYIRLMQLPVSPAASTDPLQVVEAADDAMFPLPLPGKSYNISVIVAWPRGSEPETKDGIAEPADKKGMLERYIGPSKPDVEAYPVTSDKRVFYPGDDGNYGVLYRGTAHDPNFYYSAFEYSKFKMLPVGALPESAILAFQNGRYAPVKNFSRRIAGDRNFVFSYGFSSLQDMELHFLLDTRILSMRNEILRLLADEEDHFEYVLNAIGWTGGDLQSKKEDLIASNGAARCVASSISQDPNFYGFNRWINTNVTTQHGSLAEYIIHAGFGSVEELRFDAGRNLLGDGYRSINIDPSDPNVTSEHYDVPDNDDDIPNNDD
jgi:hypothetical protein